MCLPDLRCVRNKITLFRDLFGDCSFVVIAELTPLFFFFFVATIWNFESRDMIVIYTVYESIPNREMRCKLWNGRRIHRTVHLTMHLKLYELFCRPIYMYVYIYYMHTSILVAFTTNMLSWNDDVKAQLLSMILCLEDNADISLFYVLTLGFYIP